MDSSAETFGKRTTKAYECAGAEARAGSAESDAGVEESDPDVKGGKVVGDIDFDTNATSFVETMMERKF
jgi:hypothetical protein